MHIWLKSIPVPIPGAPAGGISGITHQPWFWPAIVAMIGATFVLIVVKAISASPKALTIVVAAIVIAALAGLGFLSLHK